MNLLLFCIAIIAASACDSLEAARIKRNEILDSEVCPESHPYPFDHGEV
jgi:hypothetical protein